MNNLLDKKYITDAGNIAGASGTPTFTGGAARFYGVQLKADFKKIREQYKTTLALLI